jgi:hypothetical protein
MVVVMVGTGHCPVHDALWCARYLAQHQLPIDPPHPLIP